MTLAGSQSEAGLEFVVSDTVESDLGVTGCVFKGAALPIAGSGLLWWKWEH